jgi:hypothetical protein
VTDANDAAADVDAAEIPATLAARTTDDHSAHGLTQPPPAMLFHVRP